MTTVLRRILELPRRLVESLPGLAGLALLATAFLLSLTLTACSGESSVLSGRYVDDTVKVSQNLLSTIALEPDDPGRSVAETEARALINAYISRYRPQRDVNGLASFTTMQTAMNSLASHYQAYANRPLPNELRKRVEKELKQAEAGVARGT